MAVSVYPLDARCCRGVRYTATMKRAAIMLCCVTCLIGCVNRPAEWAQPVQVKAMPNLHRVSDTLYRSAEPNTGGLENLQPLGVHTVINLQRYRTDRDEAEALGYRYEQIPFDAWAPSEAQVVQFLRYVNDPAGAPYLVHCQHGADRSGVMCAVYRIAVQGWAKDDALREMRWGGYGYHWHMQHLIDWVNALDIERIKADAGMK